MIAEIDILMYHSISDAGGPTSIPATVFRRQMEALAECGYTPVPLSAIPAWHAGKSELPDKPVVLTFDDGFADFAATAFPVLHSLGWNATVFLPTGKMGSCEDWAGANDPPRPLMEWEQVAELADENIDFGGHSVTHANLPRLSDDDLAQEVRASVSEIEQRLGRNCPTFAPPYGKCDQRVCAAIAHSCQVSVGTRLAQARRSSNLFDLPRIEMFYFQDLRRWNDHLTGRGRLYFEKRRLLRRVRQLVVERT